MSNDPNRQYHPPQWNGQSGGYPPPPQSQYPDPTTSSPAYQYPPPPSSDMAALQPPPQEPYRLPAPHTIYGHAPDPYRAPAPQAHPVQYNQPAPRQRTAIACQYCRRRKIRCSGFDSSEDGRCTNCVRFNQQCFFTPVSAGAQAFVPAHAAYPHLARGGAAASRGRGNYPPQPPVLYGAHGQPLPPHAQGSPPDPGMASQQYYSPGYGQPGPQYDDRGQPALSHPPPGSQDNVSRKRPRLEDGHNGHLSSSLNGSPSSHSSQQRPGRRGSGGGYEYPDPTNLAPVSPATPLPGYGGHTTPQPYYNNPPPQPRRTSPQTSYAIEARPGDSPHGSASSTSAYQYSSLHPPQSLPPSRESGHTPPPASGPGSASGRSGLSVRDMLAPGDSSNPGRSSTDSDMLNALNRRV